MHWTRKSRRAASCWNNTWAAAWICSAIRTAPTTPQRAIRCAASIAQRWPPARMWSPGTPTCSRCRACRQDTATAISCAGCIGPRREAHESVRATQGPDPGRPCQGRGGIVAVAAAILRAARRGHRVRCARAGFPPHCAPADPAGHRGCAARMAGGAGQQRTLRPDPVQHRSLAAGAEIRRARSGPACESGAAQGGRAGYRTGQAAHGGVCAVAGHQGAARNARHLHRRCTRTGLSGRGETTAQQSRAGRRHPLTGRATVPRCPGTARCMPRPAAVLAGGGAGIFSRSRDRNRDAVRTRAAALVLRPRAHPRAAGHRRRQQLPARHRTAAGTPDRGDQVAGEPALAWRGNGGIQTRRRWRLPPAGNQSAPVGLAAVGHRRGRELPAGAVEDRIGRTAGTAAALPPWHARAQPRCGCALVRAGMEAAAASVAGCAAAHPRFSRVDASAAGPRTLGPVPLARTATVVEAFPRRLAAHGTHAGRAGCARQLAQVARALARAAHPPGAGAVLRQHLPQSGGRGAPALRRRRCRDRLGRLPQSGTPARAGRLGQCGGADDRGAAGWASLPRGGRRADRVGRPDHRDGRGQLANAGAQPPARDPESGFAGRGRSGSWRACGNRRPLHPGRNRHAADRRDAATLRGQTGQTTEHKRLMSENQARLRIALPPRAQPKWNAPQGAHAPAPVDSVGTPTYTAADTIADTIASVAAQTWRDFEMIVVDDGSSDHTPMVLAQHARRYPWISWCVQNNGGAAAARESAIALARGEFIAFLDADDIWEPNKLALQIAAFERNPGAAFVYTDMRDFYPDRGRQRTQYQIKQPARGNVLRALFGSCDRISTWIPRVRKLAISGESGVDSSLRIYEHVA